MKLLALLVLIVLFAACGQETVPDAPGVHSYEYADAVFGDVRIAFIHVGDITDLGWTYRHHQGTLDMMAALNIRDEQVLNFFNVVPGVAVGEAIDYAINWGANLIFGTSFAFEIHFVEAAREHPDVQFFHTTGNQAVASGLPNMHNYSTIHNFFRYMTQARYLSGIAAGLRTETNVLGFVAAFPFPEVINGFTAFYLGALSVNPDVTMYVMYANAWNNPTLETQVAHSLIDRGADVTAQHVDSPAPQIVAQERGVWSVGYNYDTIYIAPDSVLFSPMFDWSVYLIYAVDNVVRGIPIPQGYHPGFDESMVVLSTANPATIAPGTYAAIELAQAYFLDGRNIFTGPMYDTNGNQILAPGEEFIEPMAAPSWAYIIEGVTILQ